MLIKYVGKKDSERDNYVAGTGITWLAGESHEVPDDAAVKLLKHPDVWELDSPNMAPGATLDPAGGLNGEPPEDTKPPADENNPPEHKYALVKNESETVVLDAMDDDALEKFADEHGIKFDRRLKGDNRRAAIFDSATKE